MPKQQQEKEQQPGHKPMDFITRLAFGTTSLVLMAMSLCLVAYGCYQVVTALTSSWTEAGDSLLAAIGYFVIALAVFDLAKYFIEEEVIRGREIRMASEARHSLTKFVATIAIAIFIEGLVLVFQNREEPEKMIYPTILLLVAILIVLGLGAYQRLSVEVERKAGEQDPDPSARRR